VLDHQTIAVPLLLPRPELPEEDDAVHRWLTGRRPMPRFYRNIVAGEEVRSANAAVRARERHADGAMLEIVDAVMKSKRLINVG
jgi:hypothetical protein